MTSTDDLVLTIPNKTVEWQKAGGNVQHGPRRLLRSTGVHNSNTAVVSSESQGITAGGEADSLNPACAVVQEFTTDSVKGKALSPSTGLGPFISALDETGENSGVRIGRACRQ